jgi:divalent metal cation (Fe/Co/Zn/Cd) transporter
MTAKRVPAQPSTPAVAIIAASILIDYNRVQALRRVAKKTGSEALEADGEAALDSARRAGNADAAGVLSDALDRRRHASGGT